MAFTKDELATAMSRAPQVDRDQEAAAYQAPTTIRAITASDETQAIVAVYHSGVFIVASQAVVPQTLGPSVPQRL
jgi:hypothetical protein